jgi:lipid-A-disaccharide synthase
MSEKKVFKSIMVVAGELSGDQVGESIVLELKNKYKKADIFGVVGPNMRSAGCREIGDIKQLSVMGVVEVIKHLPRILKFKKYLVKQAIENKPDLFIGIDSPDFNLRLSRDLKKLGIKTVQYVSPSVWAWRQNRIKFIKKAVDHVCCLFPFEVDFYKKHNMPATFVGHPIASKYEINIDKKLYRQKLGLDLKNNFIHIALLPGSRLSEVSYMLPLFLGAANNININSKSKHINLKFLMPCAHKGLSEIFKNNLSKYPNLDISVFQGRASDILKASELALITSGTATVEAMMAKCLIIVAYKMPGLTYFILKRLVKTKYIALPNILAGKELVPEYIQDNANIPNLTRELESKVNSIINKKDDILIKNFTKMHQDLMVNNDAFLGAISKL